MYKIHPSYLVFLIAIILAAMIQLGELKKVYDCVYDPNKCSHFCGVPSSKMPKGFGCLNTLKACLCPTTPNTKMCRPINPADRDESNGCNSTYNCPSPRLIPMICEFWDQNKMCACFRAADGKAAVQNPAVNNEKPNKNCVNVEPAENIPEREPKLPEIPEEPQAQTNVQPQVLTNVQVQPQVPTNVQVQPQVPTNVQVQPQVPTNVEPQVPGSNLDDYPDHGKIPDDTISSQIPNDNVAS